MHRIRFIRNSLISVHLPNLYQVLAAVKLRRLWRQLLLMKLTDSSAQVRDEEKHKAEQNALEARLSRGLVEFVHNTTIFSIKRLLPADLKVKAPRPNRTCCLFLFLFRD